MKVARFFPVVGIVIFIYLLMNIDLQKTLDILSKSNLLLVVLTVMTLPITISLKALKWKILVNLYDKRYPLKECIKAWLMGFSMSIVTPGRIGDISRAYYIKKSTGFGKGLTTVIIDRVIDIAILFFLVIVGFLSFVTFYTEYSNLLFMVFLLFCLFILAVYAFTKKKLTMFLMRPIFYRIVPKKHRSSIQVTFDEVYDGLDSVKKSRKRIVLAIGIGFLTWIITVFQQLLLSIALGINVSFFFLLSIMPIIYLLDMLPVSFSGIGTRDAALILFFSFISIQKEYAISLSVLILLFGYILVGLAGAVLLLKHGHKPKEQINKNID